MEGAAGSRGPWHPAATVQMTGAAPDSNFSLNIHLQVMRREVILAFLFAVKPLFLALVLDQEQGEQAIARVGFGGISGLGFVGHRQEVTERAVAPAEGT